MPANNPTETNEGRVITLTVKKQQDIAKFMQIKSGLLIVPFSAITSMDPKDDGTTRVSVNEAV
ncbi:MAG: hypothetical protein Alpg2KO_21890 [Alphaproteobacteria bacterium]